MSDEELDQIDAAVHRHIMESETSPAELCTCGNKSPDYRGSYCLACGYPIAPEYTRSWSDAGEVVERMRPTHHVLIEGYWQGRWEVQFCVPSTEYTATAETLPLAITLAALAAVGKPWSKA